jgi:microcin C transport system substrate-binding protein
LAYGLLFTRSDEDDILVNDKGERATFTLIYGQKSWDQTLTVLQQDFRRAGVEMKLQLLEGSTQFERLLERKFEMGLEALTSSVYPMPRPLLSTDMKNSKNNDDFWGFGTKEVDDLISTYEHSMDPNARKQALYRVDQIIHDEAFYIPMRMIPYLRMVYWDYIQFPEFWLPKRTLQFSDWLVYWIDPEKKAALAGAVKNNTPYPVDKNLDKDHFHVKDKYRA